MVGPLNKKLLLVIEKAAKIDEREWRELDWNNKPYQVLFDPCVCEAPVYSSVSANVDALLLMKTMLIERKRRSYRF